MSEENPSTVTTLDVPSQQLVETVVPASGTPAQNPPGSSDAQGDTSIGDGGNLDQPQRGKHWASRRIDELTRERETERREKQELLQTLRSLTQQRDAPEQRQQPQVPSEYANDPGYDPQDPEPQRDDFDDYDRYQRATARWEARMEVRGETVRQQHRAHQQQAVQHVMQETAQIAQHYNQTAQAWERSHPEFNDKVESLAGIDAQQHPVMTRAIFTSHNPPAVLDALASVPEVAYRITQLPAEKQIRAIAFIESRLGSQHAQVSNAPRVGRPVGTNSASSRTAYRDDFTPEQHRAWKRANGIN